MTLKIGFRGQTYDDAVPLYLDMPNIAPAMVFNRLTHKATTKASLQAAMTAESYHAGAKEIGAMPVAWDAAHDGIWDWVAKAQAQPPAYQTPTATVTGLPAVGDAGGTKKATVDIDFHSQDIPTGGKTATITYDIGAGDVVLNAPLNAGMTPVQVVHDLVQGITAIAGLTAAKGAGTALAITPDDGTTLSKLTVVIH